MATTKKTTGQDTSAQNASPFDFTAGMDPQDYLESMRKMAAEGLTVSQENLEKAKAAMDEMQATMQQSMKANMDAAQDHSSKISMAAIESVRKSTQSAFAHMQALSQVKTVAEAFELQTAFVRKQAEDAVASAKDMQELAKGAAEEMTQPMRDAAAKAFKGK